MINSTTEITKIKFQGKEHIFVNVQKTLSGIHSTHQSEFTSNEPIENQEISKENYSKEVKDVLLPVDNRMS